GGEEQAVVRRESGSHVLREARVGVAHSARDGEVPGQAPDSEEEDQAEDRDEDPAAARPAEPEAAARAPLDDLAGTAAVAADGPPRLPVVARERHFPLSSAAAIDAIRLLPGGGHAEVYGTHCAGGPCDRGGPWRHEDPRRRGGPRRERRAPARASDAAGLAGARARRARGRS